jgi:hypothetical protein
MFTRSMPALLAVFLGFSFSHAAVARQNEEKDVAAIKQVVEQFRTSIIHKDKTAFTSLFFSQKPEEVTWQFVVDDARLARFRKTRPESKKARHIPEVNYLTFIDSVCSSEKASEEVFSDVQVDTDGEVASVNFDYSYLANGVQTNSGREMWQLIRTEEGWKIISVIWSIHDPVKQ